MIGVLRRALTALTATGAARLRRDAALVLVLAAVAGGLAAWSQAALREGLRSIDAAAAQAVAGAGRDADLLVTAPVGADQSDQGAEPRFAPSAFLDEAPGWRRRLPPALRLRTASPSVVLVAPAQDSAPGGDAGAAGITVTLAVPDAATAGALRPVAGRAARDPDDGAIEVVLPARAARDAGLGVGSGFLLEPESTASGERPVRVRVTGLVEPGASTVRSLGADLPAFTRARAQLAFGRRAGPAVTAFTTAGGAERMSKAFQLSWTGVLRLRPVPGRYDTASVAAEGRAVAQAGGSATSWSTQPATPQVRSGFSLALQSFPADAAAARGQQRTAIAGALATGLVALLLLAGSLAVSRGGGLRLERIRGLPGGAIAVRAAAESLLVALPAVALGAAAAALVVPGPLQPAPLVAILATAVLAPAVAEARRADGVRAAPGRAAVADAAAVLLAAVALVALQSGATGPDDPLLSVAPVLAALAGAVLVRRAAGAAAAAVRPLLLRGRGAVAALAAARSAGSGAGTALTAIAVAASVAVGGAVLLTDLEAGRTEASWRAVGADVRVTGALPGGAADRVARAAGVQAAAAVRTDRAAVLVIGDASTPIDLIGVDGSWSRLLAATPSTASAGQDGLAGLAAGGGATLPVLVNPLLADRVGQRGGIEVEGRTVRVRVAGIARVWPADDLARTGALVDARALAAAVGGRDSRNLLLAVGSGAPAATAGLPGAHLDRRSLLERERARALPAGVASAIGGASTVAALLALLALAAWLRSTRAERAGEAALLAVLGLPPGTPRRLLLLRTGPLVLLAVLGGAVAGALATRVLAAALGVDRLAGVQAGAAPLLPVVAAALLVALAAVAAAALLEPAARRAASLPDITALSTDGAPT